MTMKPDLQLPTTIRSRFVDHVNGLRLHYLEAGFESPNRPCILLLHGFPEIAYSWRKIMPLLSAAGYYVIAPDQRGYGQTAGADTDFDGDLDQFRILNLVRDQLGFLAATGRTTVDLVVGHDFGSIVAATCALTRPDVFQSLIMMSAPFGALPALASSPSISQPDQIGGLDDPKLDESLSKLNPPRKHYQRYYSTRSANSDMHRCTQGVHRFLRAYFHHKSADWADNKPHALKEWSAEELANLPTYYVMEKNRSMAETVAPHMPTPAEITACQWLTEDELQVYSSEYERTGFQGGLQSYRVITSGLFMHELMLFRGKAIEVPATFIAGSCDWGTHQKPGSLESMAERGCSNYLGTHLVEGAGHWVQQEQAQSVASLILDFQTQR